MLVILFGEAEWLVVPHDRGTGLIRLFTRTIYLI